MYMYNVIPYSLDEVPRALEIHTGEKTGVGAYMEKPFMHMGSKKWGVDAYTEMGAYSGEYGKNAN